VPKTASKINADSQNYNLITMGAGKSNVEKIQSTRPLSGNSNFLTYAIGNDVFN